jgi:hypothetical protein
MEGRIKRLEREWDYPANPGPDPETIAHWASLWIAVGLEEFRANAAALEFLLYCQTLGQVPTFYALVRWTQREDEGDEGNEGHLGCK